MGAVVTEVVGWAAKQFSQIALRVFCDFKYFLGIFQPYFPELVFRNEVITKDACCNVWNKIVYVEVDSKLIQKVIAKFFEAWPWFGTFALAKAVVIKCYLVEIRRHTVNIMFSAGDGVE